MKLANYVEARQADCRLILSDSDQAAVIDFFRPRDRRQIEKHIIYTSAESAAGQHLGDPQSGSNN